jgi:hypothetical protein
MFGPMKESLRGRSFSSDEGRDAKLVKDATNFFFLTELENF